MGMSESITRVEQAALALGLEIEIRRMALSTRTAEEAAAACGCAVGQIVKSLLFQGRHSGDLKLLLVSGANRVTESEAERLIGEPIERADPTRVRTETGFAIGGVAPFGHIAPIDTYMDEDLLQHQLVWAAAGAPNAVFSICPRLLSSAVRAQLGRVS